MKKSDLKAETEALICAAQEEALRLNYIKFNTNKTAESPLCRMCGEKGESEGHLIRGCKKLAQREYKILFQNHPQRRTGIPKVRDQIPLESTFFS